jgi:hypothetical protein
LADKGAAETSDLFQEQVASINAQSISRWRDSERYSLADLITSNKGSKDSNTVSSICGDSRSMLSWRSFLHAAVGHVNRLCSKSSLNCFHSELLRTSCGYRIGSHTDSSSEESAPRRGDSYPAHFPAVEDINIEVVFSIYSKTVASLSTVLLSAGDVSVDNTGIFTVI